MEFEPSAARGEALDRQMRERLADTLDYMFSELGEPLNVDAAEAARLVADIRGSRQPANLFAIYYDMVLSLEDDDLDRARQLAGEILNQPRVGGTIVKTVEQRDPADLSRLRRFLMTDLDGDRAQPRVIRRNQTQN